MNTEKTIRDNLKIVLQNLSNRVSEGTFSINECVDGCSVEYHSSSLFSLYRVKLPYSINIPLPGKGMFEKRSSVSVDTLAAKVQSRSMADAEAEGLQALLEAGSSSPLLLGVAGSGKSAVLFMEFLSPGSPASARSSVRKEGLKDTLKTIYLKKAENFGFHADNFIGNLPQYNGVFTEFSEFWWQARILPQLEMAVRGRFFSQSDIDRFFDIIQNFFAGWSEAADFEPRLIHGDLWSGNLLYSDGQTYLIDPAVAYSHPEQDFAMLELFGSPLNHSDYEEILAAVGLNGGFTGRVAFFQLYPLLVHVNIFGSSYISSVKAALERCR